MRYVSTRGGASASFEEALLLGLAPDGGLFVPAEWPQLALEQLRRLAGRPYGEVALEIIAPFVGDAFSREELAAVIAETYATFDTALVAPLVQIGPSDFLVELFHGPTFAFKDVALQLVARLYERILEREERRLRIVCATSGDTGSAAIEAVRGREGMDIFVLFPEGRVSDIQRRQMTTAAEANVHVFAVAGTFDDCQRIVKELFADRAFAEETSLTGVNSINWPRIVAQAVYYVTSALALGAPERRVSFAVPTGNFGDVYAGHVAARLGLPMGKLIIATNANDILVRALASGTYEKRGVVATSSPSMDIEVASNFERLVFEALARDSGATRALFAGLAQSGAFTLPPSARAEIAEQFTAERADEAEVANAIAALHEEAGRILDPHTAVGAVALRKARAAGAIGPGDTAVLLATAHPAKFPEAVARAAGMRPPIPQRLAAVLAKPERFTKVPADAERIKALVRSPV
ncbi:MAG: threonine synthase [Alphaproteobacteria bacterium]